MKVGLGAKIVLTVTLVLAAAFAIVATGTKRLEVVELHGARPAGVAGPRIEPSFPPMDPEGTFRVQFETKFALVGLGAIVVALLLAAHIIRPIRRLTRAVQAAGETALPHVEVGSRDEIGDLANAFNSLGKRLGGSEQARKDVIADVAHELRTPLTNVRCALEAFDDGVDEPTPEALRSVLADVLQLQRLVSDLHELSAADAAPIVLDLQPVDFLAEVRSAIASFPDSAQRIGVDASASLPPVVCDAPRIRQVLHNLIDNALRYGTRVRATVAQHGHDVRVEIADDGPGFSAEEASRIFERFYRIDASRSRSSGGSGLGLAIAKQIVAAHGGTIGAEGGDGRGATFWFTLPLQQEQA